MRFTMSFTMSLFALILSLPLGAQAAPSMVGIAPGRPAELQDVGITEHLGESVSIQDLYFTDEKGQKVQLASFFGKPSSLGNQAKKPVLLTLVYYACANLCNFLLNGLVDSLKELDWKVGEQFEVISVSINHREGSELASSKKASYLKSYGRHDDSVVVDGWHFLTGEESQIKKLASEVGFGFRYDEKDKQYAHGAVAFVLTPEGKVSRYLYGIDFPKRDFRLALLEASNGKIGTMMDRIMMFCFRYDPSSRKYSVYVTKIMQAGGAGTVAVLGLYLGVFWRRQRQLPRVERG